MADKRSAGQRLLIPAGAVALVAALILGSAWRGGFGFSTVDVEALSQSRATLAGSLLLLREADGAYELVAVGLGSREIVAAVALDRRPSRIVPTPGGVSAFVLWPDSNRVTVYDTETLDVQRDFALEGVSRPTELSFSPTGERVFVVDGEGSDVVEYRHARLDLTESRRLQLPGSGRVITNRRATRLYRVGPAEVYVYFAQTGDLVETHPLTAADARSADARTATLRFDASYTALWGSDAEGNPVGVDERTGRLFAPEAAQTVHGSPAAGDSVAFLAADGRSVVTVDPREPGRTQAHIDLPEEALQVVAPDPGVVWAITGEGTIYDLSGTSVRSIAALDLPGILETIASPVDRGGSFACF